MGDLRLERSHWTDCILHMLVRFWLADSNLRLAYGVFGQRIFTLLTDLSLSSQFSDLLEIVNFNSDHGDERLVVWACHQLKQLQLLNSRYWQWFASLVNLLDHRLDSSDIFLGLGLSGKTQETLESAPLILNSADHLVRPYEFGVELQIFFALVNLLVKIQVKRGLSLIVITLIGQALLLFMVDNCIFGHLSATILRFQVIPGGHFLAYGAFSAAHSHRFKILQSIVIWF